MHPRFQLPARRRSDQPVTIHAVLAQPETASEHCRNALTVLRFSIEHDEPLIGNGCPAIAVPIVSLARMQARLEAAIEQLEPTPEKDQPDYRAPLTPDVCCIRCHGTILPPTIGGVPRGSCHCPRERVIGFNPDDTTRVT